MFDVFFRALRNPIDYSGIYRSTYITLKEQVQETKDVRSFIFTADDLPTWKAGQHAIFTLPGRPVEGKTWRPFSVASHPDEGVIRIGTMISEKPSSFKQHLSALQPGDRIKMRGPFGEMYVNPKIKRIVGIAGGIGITPFRSIVGDLTTRQSDVKLTLIYSARERIYTYQNELSAWQEKNPNIDIIYAETPEEVNFALEEEVHKHGNGAHYFLSGPPGMITALRRSLRAQGIKRRRILNDPFKGY